MSYFLYQTWKYRMHTAMTVAVSAALMVVLNGRAEAGTTCISKATEALPRIAGLVVKKSRTRALPPVVDTAITQGRVRHGDPVAVARGYRERAEAENLSIRELVIAVTNRQQFVGTPNSIAHEIDTYIQADACDGFILVPHLTPHGLDEFVDHVVPMLQERAGFRTEYSGTTLREHLGLTPL